MSSIEKGDVENAKSILTGENIGTINEDCEEHSVNPFKEAYLTKNRGLVLLLLGKLNIDSKKSMELAVSVAGNRDFSLGDIAIMDFLLKKGVNIHQKIYDGHTVFGICAQTGTSSMLTHLYKKTKKQITREKLWDAFFETAFGAGNSDNASFFLANGCNVESIHRGKTILIEAMPFCGTNFVEFLIENKAPLNTLDARGKTALDYAIILKKDGIIKLLRKHGAKTAAELKGETENSST